MRPLIDFSDVTVDGFMAGPEPRAPRGTVTPLRFDEGTVYLETSMSLDGFVADRNVGTRPMR